MSTPDTNFSSAETQAAVVPPVSGVAQRSMLQTLIVLIRRELWEHRSLWIAPLGIAVLMVLTAFPIHFGNVAHEADFAGAENRLSAFTLMVWGQSLPQYLVMVIVVSFYLLDCLYAERKDRSILFWKSLPGSDNLTVLSKLLVALLVVPLGVFALGLLVSLSFVGIWELNAAFGRLPPIPGWDTLAWLKGEMALLACLIVGVLWYAPFAAYLLVVSAWARRSPFLWATVPGVLAPLLDRMACGTTYLWKLLAYRTYGIWQTLFPYPHLGRGRAEALASMFGQLRFGAAFSDIDMWLGLAVPP